MRGVIVQFRQQLLLFLFKGRRGIPSEKKEKKKEERLTKPSAGKLNQTIRVGSEWDLYADMWAHWKERSHSRGIYIQRHMYSCCIKHQVSSRCVRWMLSTHFILHDNNVQMRKKRQREMNEARRLQAPRARDVLMHFNSTLG